MPCWRRSGAVTARRLCLENRALRRAAQASDAQVIVGETDMIRRLRAMIPVLAQSDIDLAIEGETGTGKELFARCVHRAGPRSRHRFVTIDCAVIPAAVVEKDMFARGGLVAGSHRGTLLLDNLDQASPELQHRLAQLAEKRAIGLDTRDPEAIDVRIIATIAEGRRGHIADQLYHRIAGVPLRMPPLSERRADIRLVFAHLLRQAAERLGCTAPQLEDAFTGWRPAHGPAIYANWPISRNAAASAWKTRPRPCCQTGREHCPSASTPSRVLPSGRRFRIRKVRLPARSPCWAFRVRLFIIA
jgi:two-component system C4-dicarboxylate transport response regulator DctD